MWSSFSLHQCNFEGHVTLNDEQYKNRSGQNLDTVSQYHNPPLVITCVLAEEIDFDIGHFRNYWSYMTLTLDWVIRHNISLIIPYVHTKNFLCTDTGQMDRHAYVRTVGWTMRPALLGQLLRVDPPKYNTKCSKTMLSWFSRLLWHSARKRDGHIAHCTKAHTECPWRLLVLLWDSNTDLINKVHTSTEDTWLIPLYRQPS